MDEIAFLLKYYELMSENLDKDFIMSQINDMVSEGKISSNSVNDFKRILDLKKQMSVLNSKLVAKQRANAPIHERTSIKNEITKTQEEIDSITGDDILNMKKYIEEKEKESSQSSYDPCSGGRSFTRNPC